MPTVGALSSLPPASALPVISQKLCTANSTGFRHCCRCTGGSVAIGKLPGGTAQGASLIRLSQGTWQSSQLAVALWVQGNTVAWVPRVGRYVGRVVRTTYHELPEPSLTRRRLNYLRIMPPRIPHDIHITPQYWCLQAKTVPIY